MGVEIVLSKVHEVASLWWIGCHLSDPYSPWFLLVGYKISDATLLPLSCQKHVTGFAFVHWDYRYKTVLKIYCNDAL